MRFPPVSDLRRLAGNARDANSRLLARLKKMDHGKVDRLFHDLHHQAFAEYDCLECANCCKSISPMVTHHDVDKMAAGLRQRPSDLVVRYLAVEPDGSYVFRNQPCPFLDSDLYCLVYRHRPKACAGYPHTDHRGMHRLTAITLENSFICPVVYAILEELKLQIG